MAKERKKRKQKPKFEDTVKEIFEYAKTRFTILFDKMSIRDYVWIATYGMILYYAYIVIEQINDLDLEKYPFKTWPQFMWWTWTKAFQFGWEIVIPPTEPQEPPIPPPEEPEINLQSLSLAMGVSWVIMNTTTDDILGAAGLVTSTIRNLIPIPPVGG